MTTRIVPTAVAIALVIAVTSAHARTAPNPHGRLIRPQFRDAAASAFAPAPAPEGARAVDAVPVGLPSGAVQLDSTYYDLQDMGSLGTRIVCAPNGRIHVTWQDDFCELDAAGCPPNLNAPQPFPQRAMAYAWRTPQGAWTHVGKVQDPDIRGCCLSELFGGFGTIALTTDGRAAIAQHMNEDGCDLRGDFYLEDAVAGATWTAYLTPIVSPSYLFPQVTALPNGSFVVLGEVPRGGEYDETNDFRISRLAAAGPLFSCPTGWQCGTWTSVAPSTIFRDGRGAFPCLASASDGRVGVAVGDFGGNVFLIESSNGTFAPNTVTIRTLTNYVDAAITAVDSTSNEYRAYIHCSLAYNDTTPNVVWSELQARRVSGSLAYFDWRARIRHWSSTTGVSTVKQVAAGEADRYDDLDNGLAGPSAGFNTIAVDWPQVGFSADGSETYVAWLRFTDAAIDPTGDMGLPGIVTGIGFGDIACSVRPTGGAWSAPQNLTNTPSTDERFFSLAARNENGRAHLVFQASATNQAGVAAIGDRGSSPGNLVRRIAYLEAPLAASLVDVPDGVSAGSVRALRAFPNPALGRIRFAVDPDAARSAHAIDVLTVSGARVARLGLAPGGAEWSGRDAAGRAMPAGVYFAKLDAGSTPATKFLYLR